MYLLFVVNIFNIPTHASDIKPWFFNKKPPETRLFLASR
jgi:hypothetical protein